MPARCKRWLKWAALIAIPVLLFFVLREQRSWLPRTLVPTGAEKICYWPGRDVLVVACSDHTLRFWDAGSDRPAGQHKLIGFRGILLNLSFAADGNTLAVTGYSDGDLNIQVWDTTTWMLLRTLRVSRALKPMTAACLTPDGSQIAVGFGDTSGGGKIIIRLWNLWREGAPRVLQASPPPGLTHDDTAFLSTNFNIWFTTDGSRLITVTGLIVPRLKDEYANMANDRHIVRTWNLTTGRVSSIVILNNHMSSPFLIPSPDGTILARNNDHSAIELLQLHTGKLHIKLTGLSGSSAVCFNHTGRILAASNREVIALWDTQSGHLLSTLEARDGDDLAIAPNGRTLAAWLQIAAPANTGNFPGGITYMVRQWRIR